MSGLKIVGVVAVMIACFAIIYPRFIHPVILRALDMSESTKADGNNVYPPNYRNMHPESVKPQATQDDARRHMRPHPGMRAAAEMQKQQAQQGSGRGMMGIVLPMYAIGIVLYLVYTLFKVFNKSKNSSWGNTYDNRSGRDNTVDRMGFPTDFDGSDDVHGFLNDQRQKKELEELLTRVDDRSVSVDEMRVLRNRLEETEAQMSRILKAMQSVQSNVDKMNIQQDLEEDKARPNDLSPDMESYEVVGKDEESHEREKSESSCLDHAHSIDAEKNGEAEQNVLSDIEHTNSSSQARILKQEVDFDSIDKDSDEEMENEKSSQEEDSYDKIEENYDSSPVTEAMDLNVRQRKGRRDNEQ